MNAVFKSLPKPLALPEIVVRDGSLPRMCHEAQAVLAGAGRVYNKGGVLVLLDKETGKTYPATAAVARLEMAKCARWCKKMRANDDDGNLAWKSIPTDPPRAVAQAIVEMQDWPDIPKLKTVVDHPLWVAHGSMLEPGYNPGQQIFRFGALKAAAGRGCPGDSVQDAEAALEKMRDTVHTFPWASPEDEAACLASMLAAVSRPILQTAPLLLVSAPAPGSGKGLLARCIARFAQAEDVSSGVLPVDDAELEKRIIADLQESPAVLFYEELGGGQAGQELDSPALRNLVTSPVFKGRQLGASRMVTASTAAMVMVTANNAMAGSDSARRILEIRLDPRCECPSSRPFPGPEPDKAILARRDELISAAMTIQGAWLASGKPGLADLPPVSSFRDWTFWARAPIAWLLGVDPAQRLVQAQRTDSKAGSIALLLEAIYEDKLTQPWKASALHDMGTKVQLAIEEVLGLRPGEEPSIRKLGRWLAGAKDRIAAGLVLREHSKANGSVTWAVRRAAE